MSEFLGISMNVVLSGLLIMLAIALGSVLWVRLRHRILFDIGLRNISRRRAQSVLIILGLMLSTVIFAAALTTGDTVAYSITKDTYEKLGHVDEIVQVRSNSRTPSFEDEQLWPIGLVQPNDLDNLIAGFNGYDSADGLLPALRFPAPVTVNYGEPGENTEPVAVVMGLDPDHMAGFEDDVVLTDGRRASVADLQRAEIFVNESLAEKLTIVEGQQIDVWVDSLPRTLRVVGIVRDRYLTGWTLDEPEGLIINLDEAAFLFGLPGGGGDGTDIASFVAISNRGGVRGTLSLSDDVTQTAVDSVRTSRLQAVPIKQDRVERAQQTGANLTAIFIVLGLFSIAAGVLLIFLILLMLAAERRPEMGMSRAVGMKREHIIQAFMAEGMAYSVIAAVAGAALGVVVSLGMTRAIQEIFKSADVEVAFHVEPRSLLIAFALGVVLTYVTVVSSAWRVSRMSITAAIREIDEPPRRATGRASIVPGAVFVVAGLALVGCALAWDEAYLFGTGSSLALIGGAFVARGLGVPERPAFTVTSVAVIGLWIGVAGGNLEWFTGSMDLGLATFFAGGLLMVAAATFLIVYNADLLLGAIHGVGVVFARAVPAVRTAVAYPLAARGRTGMTIAMLSLVVFALVMISTMGLNFRSLFLNPDARGGWDIEVVALPTNSFPPTQDNPLGPLGESLDRGFYDTRRIDNIARVLLTNPQRSTIAQVRKDGALSRTQHAFQVYGADDVFLAENAIPMQARAKGYPDDRAVWQALQDDPNLAVVDGSVVAGINYANVREDRFTLDGYRSGTDQFEPIEVVLTDTATARQKPVRIIGIMARGPSETYRGVWLSENGLTEAFEPFNSTYFVRLAPGGNAEAEAADMEETLAQFGVSAVSIEKEIQEQQSLSNAFFLLIQGFLAIGLGVGLIALTVIAVRTVVERRQQIGLLRALGFTRASVAWSFVLESSFVAVLGIANGIWPALLLANRLLASDQFSSAGFESFSVPWMQIGLVALGVFAAAVLTTIMPSRQAADVPPAEALRYE